VRLFTALWPPAEVVDHLTARLPQRWPSGIRAVPPARWHVTLRFHGDDADPDGCAPSLPQLGGLAVPRLRLAGSGSFRGALWVGVQAGGAADARALTELAVAAGADPDDFRAHLTLARWRRGPGPSADLLRGYRGPQWSPAEVLLVASELRPDGPHYTVLRRVMLG